MFIAYVFIILVFYIIGYSRTKGNRRSLKTPPGPWNLPLVGNLHWFLTKFPGEALLSIAKKFGPVVYIKLGKTPVILLNDVRVWKEAFRRSELCGRPNKFYKKVFQNKSLIFSDENRELKQYISKNLKDFGMERASFESLVQKEITMLITKFKRAKAEPVLIDTLFAIPTVNVIWALLFSKRIDENDAMMHKMSDRLAAMSKNTFFLGRNPYFIPFISQIFPSMSQGKFMYNTITELIDLMRDEIKAHRNSRRNFEIRDMTDAYMDKIEQENLKTDSKFAAGDHHALVYADIFCAAIDSTSTTLEWLLLFLASNPSIQKKFQQEIDSVIGINLPALADRERMPLTRAIIQETFRLSAVDLLQFHRATEHTKISGYDIPEGSLLLPNVYGINRDPDVWEDVDTFKPERFLDGNGQFHKSDKSIAFGTGRRSCPGEAIARDQIFLFATRISQVFNVRIEGDSPGYEGKFGIVHHPRPFKAVFCERI